MEAGFASDIGGDVPDWDNGERRDSDEDAAWRDLVARFGEPVTRTEPAPWPERENVPAPRAGGDRRGFDDEGVRSAFDADGGREPDVIPAARPQRGTSAHGTRARRIRPRKAPPRPAPDDDEHYIPPAPPPLPKLDPITKGAWAALFGGPGYLVVATAAGWSVPGLAAFLAVAAFITGFAILVLRMNEPPGQGPDGPGGPDGGGDGAVV